MTGNGYGPDVVAVTEGRDSFTVTKKRLVVVESAIPRRHRGDENVAAGAAVPKNMGGKHLISVGKNTLPPVP